MFNKPLHQQPFSLPRGTSLPLSQEPMPFENVFHTPGQNAAIRFFDPNSREDLQSMRDILRGQGVKKWMDETSQISMSDYRDWAGTESDTSFLFAVLDARVAMASQIGEVRGFVYIYSEREEKFRVRRMERLGYLQPAVGPRYALEISFAAKPTPEGAQSGSGLMSSGVRQACLQVLMLLNSTPRPEVTIFGFTHPENLASQRTLEACGFVKRGRMKYDWDSPQETLLYILNWRVLQRKVREKLLQVLQNQTPKDGV